MNKTIKLLGVVAILALVGACASLGRQKPIGDGRPTTVVVDNRALLDMDIYVVRSNGQRIRIGFAPSLSKTKLTIPQGIVFGITQVRFLADPVGGRRGPVSEEITVTQGDEVSLMLPPY